MRRGRERGLNLRERLVGAPIRAREGVKARKRRSQHKQEGRDVPPHNCYFASWSSAALKPAASFAAGPVPQ